MIVSKSSGGGSWLDKKTLNNGDIAKLVTEAEEVEGQNGSQLVAKIRVKGGGEAQNVAVNAPSKNALMEAFGDNTENWVDKHLTVSVEKTLIAGKRGIALYLIPEGFKLGEDSNGYLVITKIGGEEKTTPPEYPSEEINPDDIPF